MNYLLQFHADMNDQPGVEKYRAIHVHKDNTSAKGLLRCILCHIRSSPRLFPSTYNPLVHSFLFNSEKYRPLMHLPVSISVILKHLLSISLILKHLYGISRRIPKLLGDEYL